jgi:hypothetical protein
MYSSWAKTTHHPFKKKKKHTTTSSQVHCTHFYVDARRSFEKNTCIGSFWFPFGPLKEGKAKPAKVVTYWNSCRSPAKKETH